MTQHDDAVRLRHMVDHARLAVRFSGGRKREELDTDDLYRLAMIRAVEVVGEAASSLSPQFRVRYSDIPWVEIIATRNRLIHGYDQINADILWDILQIDLPPLLGRLEEILSEDFGIK